MTRPLSASPFGFGACPVTDAKNRRGTLAHFFFGGVAGACVGHLLAKALGKMDLPAYGENCAAVALYTTIG